MSDKRRISHPLWIDSFRLLVEQFQVYDTHMKRLVLSVAPLTFVLSLLTSALCLLLLVPNSAQAAPSLLDQCVTSINDPAFTKAFILTETGFADEAALLSAVSSNSWTLQISTGPGWSPTMRGNNPDIYCGDANDNYIQFLDSNPSGSHDFFFGGAGNDTVDYMWDSRFWGGEGNDTINHNRERSIFYGGPGTNTCSDRESTGSYIATCDNNGGPTTPQATLSIADNTMNVGTTLTLTTTGGSGSGSVTFALVSAGSAGCSLSGAVLTPTSSGTCTVSATKAASGTYGSATTGTVTITVSKLTQSALTFTATATMFGTNLTLSTSGGSGTGSVTYSLTSAGSAGCSLSGAVLSTSSVGSCTVSATKASDSTYNSATTGTVSITVTAVPTTTTTTTTTVAPALEIVVNAPVSNAGQSAQPTIAPASITTTTSTPKSISVVATTTTLPVTTTSVAPAAPSIAPVAPGAAAITVGDKTETAKVERANNQVTVTAGELSATLGSLNKSGDVSALDADGNVRLKSGDVVRIKLAGFQPDSTVEAWLFSTPQLMGTAKVGADGVVVGNFTVPKNVPQGSHRIAVVAKTKDGKPATLAVGVMVGEWKKEKSITIWLIVLPIVLAILGALVLPATRRRRKNLA
jgi:hypothetical protein